MPLILTVIPRASLVLLFGCVVFCYAQSFERGVDVSTPVSASAFQCLKASGYDFVVYELDVSAFSSCFRTVAAALSQGLSADIYLFPNFPDGNPAGQIQGLASYVSQSNVTFGMLWLDIEVGSGVPSWGTCSENTAFLGGLVSAARAQGWTVGVYCSYYMWQTIGFCGGDLSDVPLWYAHYQNPPDPVMDDFVPFGNWTTPYAKQYAGTTSLCGVSVDLNNSTVSGVPPAPPPSSYHYCAAAALHLRSSPSTSASILATIPTGGSVTDLGAPLVSADGYEWRNVQYVNTAGWVANEFISPC